MWAWARASVSAAGVVGWRAETSRGKAVAGESEGVWRGKGSAAALLQGPGIFRAVGRNDAGENVDVIMGVGGEAGVG